MDEAVILDNALAQLKENGLRGKYIEQTRRTDNGIDGELELTWKKNKLNLYIQIKRELREYQLENIIKLAKNHKPFMLVAGNIFPNLKEKLRDHEIAYLDGAGNIFVQNKETYIWLDGKKNIEALRPTNNRAFTKTGLKTVFYLLWKDKALNLPHRTLAKNTGVAVGNIKNVILGLKEAGYILKLNDKEVVLQNKRALLQRWIEGYKETLKPTLLIGAFKLNRDIDYTDLNNLPLKETETVLGGEPAAEIITNYLNTKIFTVYTNEPKAALMRAWRLIPDINGQMLFYQKFWQDDEYTQLAPILLIYADLMITNDPRNQEVAERIYKDYLKDQYE